MSPTVAGPTLAQLAATGQTVFASNCVSCHGDKGQGVTAPAIIGASANLGKYNTAQGLLDFISSTMPLTAPGSLSKQQYQQLLCFLLTQNNFVQGQSLFDLNQLKNIPLK